MYPRLFELGPLNLRLFELGPITVYTYGVLLAAAYLFGLKLAMVRARARELVTVEPKVTETPEGRVLAIPLNAGYGDVVEPLSRVSGQR